MEFKFFDYKQVEEFVKGVYVVWFEQKFVYNLFFFFNWKIVMFREEQEIYIRCLVGLGYCWQFIIFVGFYIIVFISDKFVSVYSKIGMRVYGELVQEFEMEGGVDVVKYQKWLGVMYVDELQKMVIGGISSMVVMGKGVMEDQFY